MYFRGSVFVMYFRGSVFVNNKAHRGVYQRSSSGIKFDLQRE